MTNKQFVVLVLSVALALLVFARLFIFSLSPVENIVVSPERLAVIHTQARHFDNKTAFAFGGQGIYSTTELFKCFSAMESLSKIGGWKGDIYFLVDHEDCIDKNLLKSFDNKNIHIVKVKNERKDSSTGSSTSRRLFNQQPFERSMAIKTLILNHIESPTVELVVWYDCDVLFVKKDCVAEMLSKKPEITKQRPIFISMDNHVGSVAVNKSVSHDALKLWHDGILSSNSASSMGSHASVPDYVIFSKLFGAYVVCFVGDTVCGVLFHLTHVLLSRYGAVSAYMIFVHFFLNFFSFFSGSKSAESDAKFGVFDPIWADSFPSSLPNNGTIYSCTTQCALHLSSGRCNHLGT